MVDFASAITYKGAKGNVKVHRGTWTNGATGTKDIDTGLRFVTDMRLQQTGAAVINDEPTINETLPCAGNAVTIVTTGDTQDGIWEAEGY